MESNHIWSGDIKASHYRTEYYPYEARLNGKSAWIVDFNRLRKPFIQVKVQSYGEYTVTGIATQGFYHNVVRSFTLSYSMDGIDWAYYREDGKVKVIN